MMIFVKPFEDLRLCAPAVPVRLPVARYSTKISLKFPSIARNNYGRLHRVAPGFGFQTQQILELLLFRFGINNEDVFCLLSCR